jgi:methylenetetrahydrofolate dehydrogenase (NADP+)/methenyltetrahydrofolate cyclohydrolase
MELLGTVVAEQIQKDLKVKVKNLKSRGINPSLAVLLVGDDPASVTYVRAKEKVAENLGINFRVFHFATNAREDQVLELIDELNNDPKLHGIIIQLPLPKDFDTEKIIKAIISKKDVDGLLGEFSAPPAEAILALLEYYHIGLEGNIVIVGHGRLVGKPLEKILKKRGLNPRILDSTSKNLKEETLKADILISATGVPGLIKPDMVTEKAIVIDAGTAESKGEVKGDVNKEVYKKAKAYSPVPGGVGPLTVMMLMKNLIETAVKK